jgi:hypothetical protein
VQLQDSTCLRVSTTAVDLGPGLLRALREVVELEGGCNGAQAIVWNVNVTCTQCADVIDASCSLSA